VPYRYFTALGNRVNWENKYPCYAVVSLNLKSCQKNVNENFFIFPRDNRTKYSIPILFGGILSALSMFFSCRRPTRSCRREKPTSVPIQAAMQGLSYRPSSSPIGSWGSAAATSPQLVPPARHCRRRPTFRSSTVTTIGGTLAIAGSKTIGGKAAGTSRQ
jgi:hypothetical protein